MLVANDAVFSRNLETVFRAANDVRTLGLGEVQDVEMDAFAKTERLLSVRMERDPRVVILKPDYSKIRIGLLSAVFKESGLRRVRLPTSLFLLGANTFRLCRDLQEVVLPRAIEKIGKECFEGAGITRIEIPRPVEKIEEAAFKDCVRLREVSFAKDCILRSIEEDAFAHTAVERFVAPAKLKSIGQGAFIGCGQLALVRLNEGLEVLGANVRSQNGVFQGTAVRSVRLPLTLKRAWNNTFYESKLAFVMVPEGVTYLGDRCFATNKLREVSLPVSLIKIERNALDAGCLLVCVAKNCEPGITESVGLHRVLVRAPGKTKVGKRFLRELWAVNDLVLPDGIKEVGDTWFCCAGIESVQVPPSVKKFGVRAFYHCR